MIPHTYPSQLDSENCTQMVIYYLTSISGLERWKDYIPVKENNLASPELNSFSSTGAIYTTTLSDISGKQAWIEYVPVYRDDLATDTWSISALGYLATKDTIALQALAIITSYGSNAHVYLPGIGVINGLTAGNYLDSAGTTAATVDNPVGLVLDAAGSVGSELITQPIDFATWGTVGVLSTVTANSFTNTSGSPAGKNTGSFVTTKTYLYTVTYTKSDASTLFGMYASGGGTPLATSTAAEGTLTVRMTPGAAGPLYLRLAGNATVTVTNVSVKEVTGIHALQATTANKPLLRKGAVNLLTYSEQFDNAAWGKSNVSVVGNVLTRTLTTANQGVITENVPAQPTGTIMTFVARASFGTSGVYLYLRNLVIDDTLLGGMAVFNLQTGSVVFAGSAITARIVSAGNGQYDCSITGTKVGATGANRVDIGLTTSAIGGVGGNINDYINIFRAQLETGSTASTYVATTTAPASNLVGNYAWQFDGTDSLALGSVPWQLQDDYYVSVGANCSKATVVPSVFAPKGANYITAGAIVFSAGKPSISFYNGTTSADITHATTLLNQDCVISGRKVGNAKELFVNGVKSGTTNNVALGSATVTNAWIGAGSADVAGTTNPSYAYGGKIYPLIAIKGIVTDADRLILDKFIGSLSGVTI
jgi:hypothetical protein